MTAEFEKFLDMLPLVGAIMNVPAHCEGRGEHVISSKSIADCAKTDTNARID
jgi:hypothetical protein